MKLLSVNLSLRGVEVGSRVRSHSGLAEGEDSFLQVVGPGLSWFQ